MTGRSLGFVRLAFSLVATLPAWAKPAEETASLSPISHALRVAVYEAAPYGVREPNGIFAGASVDLWRRVAEDQHWQFEFVSAPSMDDILAGLEHGGFDAAIGAITITPDRLAKVDFSYPTHRSGVAVATAKRRGILTVLSTYGAVASQLGLLLLAMLMLLLVTGVLIWLFERRASEVDGTTIGKWHEGLYWAVVTMTTVGYGDKTPKTNVGRAVAVFWMLGSLVIVSLLSTSIVAQITTDRLGRTEDVHPADLVGKRLGAVKASSGAEYLAAGSLPFEAFPDLGAALDGLDADRIDAVVNSVGALDHIVSERYRNIEVRRGLLAPAFLGFALPPHSALRAPLDRSLVRITTGPEWPAIEATYLGH